MENNTAILLLLSCEDSVIEESSDLFNVSDELHKNIFKIMKEEILPTILMLGESIIYSKYAGKITTKFIITQFINIHTNDAGA